MLNGVLTRWELTPEEKFEDFLIELVGYLKTKLVTIFDSQISYTCTHDIYPDADYVEPFERVANFCIEKNLNPHEVIDMIDEYTEEQYSCECYLFEDEKIKKLIQRPRHANQHIHPHPRDRCHNRTAPLGIGNQGLGLD